MSAPEPPLRIGRELGRGAVAAVHELVDAKGAVFAAKLLHASRDGDEAAALRFAQEAALLEGLAHPNLVRVHGMSDARDDAGQARRCLVMECVDGPSLDLLIAREAPFPEARALAYLRQIAAGLAHAHGEGIVHRDLKPGNVLVDTSTEPPRLAIADFGMARASSLTGVDAAGFTVLGTPDYMGPETIDPLAIDARTDLYALGCIAYELVTGRVPFTGATAWGVLAQHRDAPVPKMDEGLSPGFRALVEALLAKSPADRPPSAQAVVERIDAISATEGGALVLATADEEHCPGCGQAWVEHLQVCLNCGLPGGRVTPGEYSVIVTGPGEVGDKLSAELRERLVRWLYESRRLGLEVEVRFEKHIPRLPFVWARGVAHESAEALAQTLATLGLEAETYRGAVLRHPLLRKKAVKLGGRISLIILGSMAGVWHTGVVVPFVLLFGGVGAFAAAALGASQRATRLRSGGPRELSPPLAHALREVEAIVPALVDARHRHGLRAIVRDAVALHDAMDADPDTGAELGAAVRSATAATASLARIDAQLAGVDLARADEPTRALLHRRDVASGKMLALAGSLDALRERVARVQGRVQAPGEDALEDIRLQVAALEEVQSP